MPDDILAKIIANGANYNNKRLFDNYLNTLEIKFVDTKRAIVAKVFYYILHDRIDFSEGIRFVDVKVVDDKNVTKYHGDDVGIEQIFGNYYGIEDGNFVDEKGIESLIEFTINDMKQYVNDHLVNFSIDNNISKDNEKTVINAEIEKEVRVKLLAKGIRIMNYLDKLERNRTDGT